MGFRVSFCGLVANMLDWDIVENEFEFLSLYVPFRVDTFGKGMKPLFLSLWVE